MASTSAVTVPASLLFAAAAAFALCRSDAARLGASPAPSPPAGGSGSRSRGSGEEAFRTGDVYAGSALEESTQATEPELPKDWSQHLVDPHPIAAGEYGEVWKYSVSSDGSADEAGGVPQLALKAVSILQTGPSRLPCFNLLSAVRCEAAILERFGDRTSGDGMNAGRIVGYLGSRLVPDSGFAFILMELAAGDLTAFTQGRTFHNLGLSASAATFGHGTLWRDVFANTMRAVRALERAGFVHGDIKPGNVLLVRDPESERLSVRLADLGHACPLRTDHSLPCKRCEKPFSRTAAYQPPEAQEPSVPHRIDRGDTWALGIILYEMIFRHLPFGILPPQSLAARRAGPGIVSFDVSKEPKLKKLRSSYPELERLLRRMLARDPEHRPSVRDCLQAFVSLEIDTGGESESTDRDDEETDDSEPPVEEDRRGDFTSASAPISSLDFEVAQHTLNLSSWFQHTTMVEDRVCCCPSGPGGAVDTREYCRMQHDGEGRFRREPWRLCEVIENIDGAGLWSLWRPGGPDCVVQAADVWL